MNPSDLIYQLPTTLIFKRFPERFTSASHSLSLKKRYPILVPKNSRKSTHCPSSTGGCFKTGETECESTAKYLITMATFNISPAFLLIYPESFHLIRWRPKPLFLWSREHIFGIIWATSVNYAHVLLAKTCHRNLTTSCPSCSFYPCTQRLPLAQHTNIQSIMQIDSVAGYFQCQDGTCWQTLPSPWMWVQSMAKS